jgi:hypothetical protein
LKKFLPVLLILISGKLIAQKNIERIHGNFSFGAAIPLNAFKENTTSAGFGVNLHFYIPFQKDIPLYFGIGFGYYNFGSNKQDIHEDLNVTAGNTVISTIPIDFNVETNNNLVNGFLAVRVKAPLDIVQPYLEIKGGFNYLYTRTAVYDNTEDKLFTKGKEDNLINSRTPSSGFTYAYGVEGGFIIKPWKNFGINLSAEYLIGGKSEYYDKSQTAQWTIAFNGTGSFNPTNPDAKDLDLKSDAASPRKSITDVLLISAGVTFYFPGKGGAVHPKKVVK